MQQNIRDLQHEILLWICVSCILPSACNINRLTEESRGHHYAIIKGNILYSSIQERWIQHAIVSEELSHNIH